MPVGVLSGRMHHTRRRYLSGSGGSALPVDAGCLGRDPPGEDDGGSGGNGGEDDDAESTGLFARTKTVVTEAVGVAVDAVLEAI